MKTIFGEQKAIVNIHLIYSHFQNQPLSSTNTLYPIANQLGRLLQITAKCYT